MPTASTSTSASASPGPSSGPSFLELHNQHAAPKPFKRVETYSTSSTGRKRNLKQILAFEQDAAFELAGIGGSGRGGAARGKSHKKGANAAAGGSKAGTGTSTPTGAKAASGSGGGKQLIGAAAKAARKREERLRREREKEEAAAAAEAAAAGEDTPVPPTGEAAAAVDGDETMGDVTIAGSEAGAAPEADEKTEEQKAAEEKERQRKLALPTYLNIEAPPSLRPAKKYCDVTGLLAPYTDPKTGLRYHSAEIYEVLKTFGPGVDQAYLGLRGRKATLM